MERLVKCNRCGWVHVPVTRYYAEISVRNFNAFYETLSADKQQEYYNGRPASLSEYTRCVHCGADHSNFTPALPGDCPVGCTVNPIIYEKKDAV